MVGSDVVYRPGPYANVNQNLINQDDASKSTALRGFLKQETVKMLWSPIVPYSSNSSSEKKSLVKADKSDKVHYGMGWAFMPPSNRYAFCKDQRCFISHTGGAMGASSVLLILPRSPKNNSVNAVKESKDKSLKFDTAKPSPHVPEGVVVTIICNTSSVSLSKLALDIAKVFETLRPTVEGPYRVQKVYQC